MSTLTAEAALFAMLRGAVGEQHAHWCTRRPCNGVCTTTVTVTGDEGRRYQLTAELPHGAPAPTMTVADEWTGQRLTLDASAVQQIAGLVAGWSARESQPTPGMRPQQ
ncbi:hypothetical protein AB0B94_31020 [Micromonospora sp. NPDC048986]|uniref:hypothetical protein n=1 Tax=Micromonospora sp. NPDC048986 TaxID=3155644 RepID=UPI0033CD6CAA